MQINNQFENKIILITGGTGSIGSEIVKQILTLNPKQVRILSRDENKQYYLLEKLNYPKNLRTFIGDIRDLERLDLAFENVDIIFHAAALKHVPLCEYNVFETVKTNIIGSQNIVKAALKNNVKKVIAISTDKAANPVNVMGASKLMMEKIFINANYYTGNKKTSFSCVRFGNVTWSNGSVLPLWEKQIKNNKTIKVTNRNMTRFLMSKEQATSLVLRAVNISHLGEIFILKMPSIKLIDLAQIFTKKYYDNENIKINYIGNRNGEKLHEDLFDFKDLQSKILEDDYMFIILPDFTSSKIIKNIPNEQIQIPKNKYKKFYEAKKESIKKYSSSKNCINKNTIISII